MNQGYCTRFITTPCFKHLLIGLVLVMGFSNAYSMQDSLSVNLRKQNISIAQVFKALHQQTGLIVFYNNKLLNDQEKINVHFKHASVKQVMNSVVKDKDWSYAIKNSFILLKNKMYQVPLPPFGKSKLRLPK